MYVNRPYFPEIVKQILDTPFPNLHNQLTTKRNSYIAMKKHIIGCVVKHKKTQHLYIIDSVIYGSGFSGLGGWYSRYNYYFEVMTTKGSNIPVNDLIFFDEDENELTYGQYTDKYWPAQPLTAVY